MSTGRAELSIFSDFRGHGPMPLGKHESRLLRQPEGVAALNRITPILQKWPTWLA